MTFRSRFNRTAVPSVCVPLPLPVSVSLSLCGPVSHKGSLGVSFEIYEAKHELQLHDKQTYLLPDYALVAVCII